MRTRAVSTLFQCTFSFFSIHPSNYGAGFHDITPFTNCRRKRNIPECVCTSPRIALREHPAYSVWRLVQLHIALCNVKTSWFLRNFSNSSRKYSIFFSKRFQTLNFTRVALKILGKEQIPNLSRFLELLTSNRASEKSSASLYWVPCDRSES